VCVSLYVAEMEWGGGVRSFKVGCLKSLLGSSSKWVPQSRCWVPQSGFLKVVVAPCRGQG
jgi:hypothetical protein